MAVADLPLLQQSHVTYLGAYRVPSTKHASETHTAPLSYACGKCVYNPGNNSLIMAGNEANQADNYHSNICELILPATAPSTSSNINDLPVCTWAGPSVNVAQYIPNMAGGTWIDANGQRIGSLTIDSVNSRLVVGAWLFYDGGGGIGRPSHFSMPLNISTTNAGNVLPLRNKVGTYAISTGGNVSLYGACFALYSTIVPSTWQSVGEFNDVSHLCGCSQVSVVERAGASPVCWSFDPTYFSLPNGDPALASPQSSTMFLHSYVNDLTWPWNGAGNGVDRYDGDPQLPYNSSAGATNMAAIPGTRTLIYTGSVGTAYLYYGSDVDNEPGQLFANGQQDDKKPGRSYHSVAQRAGWRKLPLSPALWDNTGAVGNTGVYSKYAWMYDAVDLLRVKAGTLHPRNLLPYSYFPIDTTLKQVYSGTIGGAWDATNRRLFVIDRHGADTVGFSEFPLIHVYSVASPTGAAVRGTLPERVNLGTVR